MQHSRTERALHCPACNNLIYPVIAPSVIVAVINGNKLLLTRYQVSHSAYRNYALVAGYVETGETVEDTVRREVMEEVGLKVKNIRYYKSQPWSFSGALLLGFFCEVDGDDTIVLDESELEEAIWVEREQLPDRSGDVSLTSEMMECVRNEKGNKQLYAVGDILI
jgi:NAD+ diphosphatase